MTDTSEKTKLKDDMLQVKYLEQSDRLFENLMRDDPKLAPSPTMEACLTVHQVEAIKLLHGYSKTPLLPHQQQGLVWMLHHENTSGHGGLVLDDAGMGKTLMLAWYVLVQNVAQVQYMLATDAQLTPKPSLIVVPPNLVKTWRDQFHQHFDMHQIECDMGVQLLCCAQNIPLEAIDSLTNGNVNESLLAHHPWFVIVVISDTRLARTIVDRKNRIRAKIMIVDEAHHMQNLNSRRFKSCSRVVSSRTWVVTATPIVNSLVELFPLLYLCQIPPFNQLRKGQETYYSYLPQVYRDRLEKAKSYASGHHWAKKDDAQKKKMLAKKKPVADELERLQQLVDEFVVTNSIRRSKANLDLPQLTERAALLLGFEVETIVYRQVHRVFKDCAPLMRNTPHQYVILEWVHILRLLCSHSGLGLRKLERWVVSTLMIPDTKRDAQQRAMIGAANTLKRQVVDVFKSCHVWLTEDMIDDQDDEDNDNTSDLDHWHDQDNTTTQDNDQDTDMTLDNDKEDNEESKEEDNEKEEESKKRKRKSKKLNVVYLPSKFVFVLNLLRQQPQRKTIVVSQWVAVAREITSVLENMEYSVFYVDGTVPVPRRMAILERFAKCADPAAVLVTTLKSVNEGFTIVCASRMVLLDSWWNNTCEYQLFNRVYRVGQTEDVEIWQLYMNNTIETRIRERKNNKFLESLCVLGFSDVTLTEQMFDWVSLF